MATPANGVGDQVQYALFRRTDPEGRGGVNHPLRVGQGSPLPLRGFPGEPAAGVGLGDHLLQGAVSPADYPVGCNPDRAVLHFRRLPPLHAHVAIPQVRVQAEFVGEPLLLVLQSRLIPIG